MKCSVDTGVCPKMGWKTSRLIATLETCMWELAEKECHCFSCFCRGGHLCEEHGDPCEGSGCDGDFNAYMEHLNDELDYILGECGFTHLKLWIMDIHIRAIEDELELYEKLLKSFNTKEREWLEECKQQENDHYAAKYAHEFEE